MENLDLLTTNKFVEKGVYNLSSDQKKEDYLRKRMEFRMFMEKKKSKFTPKKNYPKKCLTFPKNQKIFFG